MKTRNDSAASPDDRSEVRDPVHVLVVDDQPENLLSMEALLTGPEVRLVLARSGNEALRAILDYDFALILLDVQMPGIDGFETAEFIRQRERSRNTPIIFVTAINKSQRNIFQGYSLGAVDYIFKPFMPEILKSKVAAFVQLHRKSAELKRQRDHYEAAAAELEAFARALSSDLPAILAPTNDPDLEPGAGGGFHGRRLFRRLLDFSLTLRREPVIGPVSLTVLLRGILESIPMPEEGRAIRWALGDLPEVRGDAEWLDMLFRNVLEDILFLTRTMPAVSVEIGSYPDRAEGTVVYVKDNGNWLKSAGEADYFGVAESLEDQEAGEGLGLSLTVAHRIVRCHGGRGWVRSEPGQGETLYFTIPGPHDLVRMWGHTR